MALAHGTRLGVYEILSAVGAGGMGEVYRARDTRLDRVVALKVLPETLGANPHFRERFDREARALSQLTHPHICTLYDVGEHQGTAFLVMEYLDGETLEHRLKKGALPLDQALQIAVAIADALAVAHRRGIVHRDLKPSNVMLAKGGAKLLDFGLAKTSAVAPAGAGLSMLSTTPPTLTQEGTILGTFQYMAPEQLEGHEADARTDIFALGTVVYEMVTGRKAFEGKSQASLIGAIMHSEPPPIAALQPISPPVLDRIVRKCLGKEPDTRWQSAADLADEFRWLIDSNVRAATEQVSATRQPARYVRLIVGAGATFVGAAAVVFGVAYFRMPPLEPPEVRFEIPATFPLVPNGDFDMAVSPDGQRLALVLAPQGRTQILVRALNGVSLQALAGTEGASYPFWAPTSGSLGFFADGKLKRVDLEGGPAQSLAPAPNGRGGTWNVDNEIVFAPNATGPLFKVHATAPGDPVAITKLDPPQLGHVRPSFLSDGQHVVFDVGGSPDVAGVYVTALDGSGMRRLAEGLSPAFVRPGRLLFLQQGTLYAQAFDPTRFLLTGDPVRVVDQVGGFSASGGTLAYRGASPNTQQLRWFDRGGRPLGTVGPDDANLLSVELSPDGTGVAAHRADKTGNLDIWLIDAARNVMTRITSDAGADRYPLWSPDGNHVVFDSNRSGTGRLYEKAVTGSEKEHLLVESPTGTLAAASDWSRDGRFILYRTSAQPGVQPDLWAIPLAGDRKPFPWLTTPFDEFNGQFSPDTRWVAYGSDETGRFEVYIQSFPTPGVKYRVSTDGGVEPRWRGDGREIFYLAADGTLMAVTVTPTAAAQGLELSKPSALFQTRTFGGFSNNVRLQYAVTRDAQRFLVNSMKPGESSAVTVVVNSTVLRKN